MNIEQKNMLFIITLSVSILASVSALFNILVSKHANVEINNDLENSHQLFIEISRQNARSLLDTAEHIRTDIAIRSSILTNHPSSISSVLQEYSSRPNIDLIAVYPEKAPENNVASFSNKQFSSVDILSSRVLIFLKQKISSEPKAIGYIRIQDRLLQLVALPIKYDPVGKIGSLVLGREVNTEVLNKMKPIIHAEIMLFDSNIVLGSSLSSMEKSLDIITSKKLEGGYLKFDSAEKSYAGKIYPILDTENGSVVASFLLSISSNEEWTPYLALKKDSTYYLLLILLIAALISIYLSRLWLTKPIKLMLKSIQAVGKTGLPEHIDDRRNDELGELASSFNSMVKSLEGYQDEDKLNKQRFHDFAESSSDWLWETNSVGILTYVSSTVSVSIGYSTEDLLGKTFGDMFGEKNLRSLMEKLSASQNHHLPIKDEEIWITTLSSIRICIRISATPYFSNDIFEGYRGTARDITQTKNDEARLVRLANRDHLSGLSNRRRFMEDIEREINISKRRGVSGALLIIDLDHFKLVNDTAGHAAGDEVIIQMAGLLRRISRDTDLVARLSGDEFVIAFINTELDHVLTRANEILKETSQLKPSYGGKIVNISTSIGIVTFPKNGTNPNELLAKADSAMYTAKENGRNRVHLYNETDQNLQRMGAQLSWKEKIHDALEDDRFVLAFQALAPTNGDPVSRYEVLVRMKSSDGTLHMPGSFIPNAEHFGLIHQVDQVIVQKAIRILIKQSESNPFISFSINLSGLSVGDPEMMVLIQEELSGTDIDRKRFVFEVTESAAFQDINRATEFIARIQQMGCRIALDDFGVGFSSFSYLKQLRANILKIDGSFIRDIQNNKEDQLFVKALVYVAKGMGMQTVAEFVETKESFEIIRELGVDFAQGYYIGKPELELFTE